MNIEIVLLIIGCFALIISAIVTIFQSAKKFKLTEEQQQSIKAREKEQQLKDKNLEP